MKFSFHLPLPSNINCDKATNSGLIVARTTRVAAEWPAEFPDFDIVAQFTIFTSQCFRRCILVPCSS